MRYSLSLILLLLVTSCKQEKTTTAFEENGNSVTITYAKGFSLIEFSDYTLLEVTAAYPEMKDTLRYGLVKGTLSRKRTEKLSKSGIQHFIKVPLTRTVVTSTTHIPSLEMLGVEETLVGFPNLDYISSEKTRERIDNEKVAELGQNQTLNTEVTLSLEPDAVVGFGIDGENKAFSTLEKAGVPVLYNGDWVEKNPLGKAEWIKFFGALYDKNEEANTLFKEIETGYIEAKELAQNTSIRPTVLSGGLFKDVWYVPNGDSWPAQLIADSGGNYLWKDTSGTGSISLSIESVLDKAQDAQIWIAPGQYTSAVKMKEDYPVYDQFLAFQNKKVITFAQRRGATGGLLYYELAPNRPDLVLKDLVFYLHPELLPQYTPYFFTPLED